MRRYIAYWALGAAMMVASGAAFAPIMRGMDADLAYADGQTLYFKASHFEDDSINGNYGLVGTDGGLSFLDENDIDNEGEYIVSDIAATMRSRLDTWGISEYEVLTQGYDTIAVSIRTPKDDATQYTNLADYLSFSGQNYELDASNTSSDSHEAEGAYNHNEKWETMIDGQTARIEEIDMSSYSVPVVVVPIASDDDSKSAFLDLLDYCANNTQAEEKDDEGNVTKAAKSCNLVIWANRSETDKYEDRGTNVNVSAKIVGEWNCQNDSCVWYESDDDKEDKVNPHLQLIPQSAAITSEGQYNPDETKAAYEAALYLCNKLNASAYTYKNASGQETRFHVSYTYKETAKASVESLMEYGKWGQEGFASTKTLWSVVITIALLAVVVACFERVLAMHHIANVLAVSAGSLALFSAMGAQFNIAALVALGTVAIVTLFGSLYHSRRLKDELYKGRTLKKANQEATKRATLPIIDAGVISAIIGVFVYVLGGDILAKGGVMLVIGGLLSIVANLVLTRLQFWLLANDSTFPSHIKKQLGINTEKIPDLSKEEKQSYFGVYADKDFTKGKRIAWISMCALILAGIGTMIGFGVTHDGNVYNSSAYEGLNTVLRIDVKKDKEDHGYVLAYSETGRIYDEDAAKDSTDDIFHQYKINGKTLAELTEDFKVSESPKVVYSFDDGSDTATEYHWYYYEAVLNAKLDEENLAIHVYDGNAFVDAGISSLSDLAEVMVDEEENNLIISFKSVSTRTQTPYLYQVALGVGIGLAVTLVYMMIRYRPSRGIAATVIATATSYLSVAFFSITRISTAAIAGLAAMPVAVLALVFSLYVLGQEKNIYRDAREKDKNTLAFRSECLDLAARRESHSVIVLFLLAWLVAISCFGFGPLAYAMPHLGMVIGLAFTLLAVLCLLAPFSLALAKLFSKLSFKPLKKKKAKKGGQLLKKRASAEPEEAIFIGIND